MTDHNPKPMNKEELEKYIEKDFLPSLLSKFPNIPDLVAENARLKAEVERLRKFNDEALAHIAKEERKSRECLDMAQAEVERLRNLGIKLDGYVDLLQGENERLRKAGDACANAAYAHCMCQNCEELRDQWRDAKRGKQP